MLLRRAGDSPWIGLATDVLIRNEGVRYIAHDALPAGRYALLGKDDERVTILDFGSSQAPAK